MSWYVYILRCGDDSLYTGVTTDVQRRLEEHRSGKGGAKYTRHRTPIELAYLEPCASRGEAQKRESEIKSLKREEKEKLLADKD